MIRYAMRCDQGHDFEGWFRSASAFDATRAAGHVACTECGSVVVEKSLMAPAVPAPRKAGAPQDGRRAAIEALRREIESKSDYVGPRFADEARAIHEGRAPGRSIHGEARLDDARKLVEDGIAVAPLPFVPRQKAN